MDIHRRRGERFDPGFRQAYAGSTGAGRCAELTDALAQAAQDSQLYLHRVACSVSQVHIEPARSAGAARELVKGFRALDHCVSGSQFLNPGPEDTALGRLRADRRLLFIVAAQAMNGVRPMAASNSPSERTEVGHEMRVFIRVPLSLAPRQQAGCPLANGSCESVTGPTRKGGAVSSAFGFL